MLIWARLLVSLTLLLVPGAAMAQTDPMPSDRTDQLALLINRARVERGVLPLSRVDALNVAAQRHTIDMATHNFLDHTGSDGSDQQERAERAGYHVPPGSAWIVVEVISAISDDPAGPLDWWLNQSPDVHGKVLTDPRWREFGIGYTQGGEFGNYWSVLVGCRPDVLPTVVLDGKSYQHTERCGTPAAPSITSSVLPSGDVEVRWSGIASPTARDWIGVYRENDPEQTLLAWQYVSCSTAPLAPRATGWCWLHLNVPPGRYELRLHPNDQYTEVASVNLSF